MTDKNTGLGDLYYKSQDPLEQYFDMTRQGVPLSRKRWMVKPDWKPKPVKGMEALQQVFENHVIPRNWELLVDLWTKFQCGTYFVKGPNWLEPPITAVCLDVRTEDCVTIAGGTAGVLNQLVLRFTVPDRHIGTLTAIGHALQNAVNWGQVTWHILINTKEVRCYGATATATGFRQQIGTITRPTPIPMPIRVKYKDIVDVTLDVPAGVTACAFFRWNGWMWQPPELTQDGSFGEYHTM